jgi:hypothetical protein
MTNSSKRPSNDADNAKDLDRIDSSPIWIRPLLLTLSIIGRVVGTLIDSPTARLLHAVVDSVIFSLVKVPFAVRSYLKRAHGSRVWRNCAYGPRSRNRLDVYLPDPELDVGRFGKAVILFVHGYGYCIQKKTVRYPRIRMSVTQIMRRVCSHQCKSYPAHQRQYVRKNTPKPEQLHHIASFLNSFSGHFCSTVAVICAVGVENTVHNMGGMHVQISSQSLSLQQFRPPGHVSTHIQVCKRVCVYICVYIYTHIHICIFLRH